MKHYGFYKNGHYTLYTLEQLIDEWKSRTFEVFEDEPPEVLVDMPEFHIAHAKEKYEKGEGPFSNDHLLWFRYSKANHDLHTAKVLIGIFPELIRHFAKFIRNDKEVIKIFFSRVIEEKHLNNLLFIKGVLLPENRIKVAYEICKEWPQYEECIGSTLRRKLGGKSVVQYVESAKLKRKLDRKLPLKQKREIRTKL